MFWNTTYIDKNRFLKGKKYLRNSSITDLIKPILVDSKMNKQVQESVRPRQIASKTSIEEKQWLPKTCPATTNSSKIKHRRQTLKHQNVLEHHIYRQNQASKANNKIQKCFRPRQIASESSIEDKQWLPESCPATTNTSKIKHRRKAMSSRSTSGHDKYHQKQASKANNKISKCSGTPQIAAKSSIEGKQ